MAENDDLLKKFEGILFRGWLIGLGFLVATFVVHQLFAKQIYDLHGSMFGLTGHELDVIIYCFMGLLKMAVLVLFLIPWLAIKTGKK